MERGRLIIVSGYSGVGKGTVIKELMKRYPGEYAFSVSATTRSPRPGETDGVEYFFVSNEEFGKMIEEGKLLEYTNYQGNFYGTPSGPLDEQLDKGVNIILDIEIEGAGNVKALRPEALSVFIIPPSAAELESRIRSRGSENVEQIRGRLLRACDESIFISGYDCVIVNESVGQCAEVLRELTTGGTQSAEDRAANIALGEKVAEDIMNTIMKQRRKPY